MIDKKTESNPKDNYYILVFDSLWDNPLSNKPGYLAVFLYILSHAYKKDREFIFNNQKIIVKRGQWFGSFRKIANHFDMSISTVFNICQYLKTERIIEHQPNAKFTLFTVLNYDRYQPQLNAKLNNSRTVAETKDNVYKVNKDIYKYGKPTDFKKKLEEFKSSFIEKKNFNPIQYDWQAEAFRIAKNLDIQLSGNYKSRWLKLFKEAFSNNKRSLLYSAYSYLYDYPKKLDNEGKIKLFFWKFNNPNKKAL